MQEAYTQLVDVPPMSEAAALYDAWKTKNVKTPRAALAVVNFASYGAFLGLGQSPPIYGSGDLTDEAIKEAFAEAQVAPKFTSGPLDNRPFLKILVQVAIKLLPLIVL